MPTEYFEVKETGEGEQSEMLRVWGMVVVSNSP